MNSNNKSNNNNNSNLNLNKPSYKGIFITLEGGEGSGKTTILNNIESYLNKKYPNKIVRSREPGGVRIAEDIRNIILDKQNTNMDGKTEALLYAASRRQHLVEKVFPNLKEGKIVISDRYLDSSLVYQGFAREIGIKQVLDINLFAIDNTLPELTLILDLDPELGLSRINKNNSREVNRLDLESLNFHKKVRQGYLELKNLFKDRIKIIDASKSIEEVTDNCIKEIENLLKEKNYK